MSFISVKRYWGDEPKLNNEESLPNSLQNLLLKIEERRKKQKVASISETCKLSHTEKETPLEEPPVKKKKLDRPVTDISSNNEFNSIKNENFTIISNFEFKKTHKLKRVLPNWLEHPTVVSIDLKNLTTTVGDIPDLDKSIVSSLKRNKITHFFPVQGKLIPWLLNYHRKCKKFWPRDVCVSAPTGSGKTLAFVLPIIQLLRKRVECYIRALVVLPTKDLAAQVFKVFKQYLIGTNLKAIHLGKLTLEKEKFNLIFNDEVYGYCSLVDIVVTTPGRLVDHLKYTHGFSLANLEFLVIDEADHVMDSVQNDWLSHLHNYIPPFGKHSGHPYLTLSNVVEKPRRPQKLLFSATLSQDPEKLSHLNLFQPHLLTSISKSDEENTESEKHRKEFVGKFATPAELTEYYTICPLSTKPVVLYHIIKQNKWKHILCFVDSVSNVHKLTSLLQELNTLDEETSSWNIVEISSKLSNIEHREILGRFSKGVIDILVTTDTLARGIDLQNLKYVVLYNSPKFVKNYIHRVGRTGRAGQEGTSLVLVTPDEKDNFENILTICGKKDMKEMKVHMEDLKKLEAIYKNSLEALRENIQVEKETSVKTMIAAKRGKILNSKKNMRKKKKRTP